MASATPNACSLVGLGKSDSFGPKEFKDAVSAAVKTAADTGAAKVSLFVNDWPIKARTTRWKARHAVIAAAEAIYRFEDDEEQAIAGADV